MKNHRIYKFLMIFDDFLRRNDENEGKRREMKEMKENGETNKKNEKT